MLITRVPDSFDDEGNALGFQTKVNRYLELAYKIRHLTNTTSSRRNLITRSNLKGTEINRHSDHSQYNRLNNIELPSPR